MKRKILYLIVLITSVLTYQISDNFHLDNKKTSNAMSDVFKESTTSKDLIDVLKYRDREYVEINNNVPKFTDEEMSKKSFEEYSDLDSLGRCGVCFANVSKDTMPTKERESIGMIKPSGWHTVKYDNIDGKYLYNRCHLIGYQLTGENKNEKNLITCTRQMNAKTMLKFENMVSSYVKKTNNHVLYRVTPIFEDDNLLATGVEIEAKSVEDNGSGISFNVFIYNVQEKITIDYKTGESSLG